MAQILDSTLSLRSPPLSQRKIILPCEQLFRRNMWFGTSSTDLLGGRRSGARRYRGLAVHATLSEPPSRQSVMKPLPGRTPSQNGPSISRPRDGKNAGGSMLSLKAKIVITKKRRPSDDEKMVDMMDVLGDFLGQKIALQLVSEDVDSKTQKGNRSQVSAINDWAAHAGVVADKVQYSAEFLIPSDFGFPGALIVTNKHQNEIFVESVSVTGHPSGTVHFPTHSWVHTEKLNPTSRIFFRNQAYLPSSTPKGLQDLREDDLMSYRGNRKVMRKQWENVYDYDVYNDLSDVDKDKALKRPVLGGSKEHPYPRRNRSGRPHSKIDPAYETRLPGAGDTPYVPRDERFEEIKYDQYFSGQIRGLVQKLVPAVLDHFRGSPDEFDSFEEIDQLYTREGVKMNKRPNFGEDLLDLLRDLPLPGFARGFVDAAADESISVLRYPRPEILAVDRFAWLRDGELARQSLAGLNPCVIQRLKAFPPVSALDNAEVYGPRESAIKREHISHQLDDLSVEEALDQGKLFILDYHDIFMPYVNRINALGGRQAYASRMLFFLQKEGTLKPLAIELSLPPPNESNEVFLPADNSTDAWLWKLAKAHVNTNDTGYHQLISHWLRTHACTEPLIIATNRQLSPMHPIFKLLHPHFRYTMEINAAARQTLIAADGVIENVFLPGKYAMEMSSAVYDGLWRFDTQGLPRDLIERGMAVEDQSAPYGLKLLIEDYPYAQDGLLVWSAIEEWVKDYVSIFYKGEENIKQDRELQSWWKEIRTRGHEDKKDEEWWPQLETKEDLVRILTTMIWINSGHHAAVNFGQFNYAGYVPNKPTLMRKPIPPKNTPEFEELVADPEAFFLSSLPSQAQSTVLMAVVESLSTHSPDEQYLGLETQPHWYAGAEVIAAFRRFNERLSESEDVIGKRNKDPSLKNRNGAGIIPYELLLRSSKPGITGRGIPNSISI